MNDHGRVTDVSASQRAVPDAPTSASFQGASTDGEHVFFTSDSALTDDAVIGGSRYLYEYVVSTGRLRLLTANGNVAGVLGVSADGSTVYLMQGDDLAVVRDGVERVAVSNVLLPGDPGDIRGSLVGSSPDARVAADGRTLLFLAEADLTDFRSDATVEAYIYSEPSGTITCISCNPRGQKPAGPAGLSFDFGSLFMINPTNPRNLSAAGDRAYFQTPDSLVPVDDNGAIDVYEWENGQVRLVSDGRATQGSYFFDASVDGSDVFFATAASLVPQDVDNGSQDIYDARIGGGFAPPPSTPNCDGDDCQGTAKGPSAGGAIVATEFEAPAGDGTTTKPMPATTRLVKLNRQALRRFASTGKTTFTVILDRGATVTVHGTATARRKTFKATGTVAGAASTAGRLVFRVTLTRAARRQLAKQQSLSLRISVAVKGGSTNRTTIKLTSAAGRRGR